MAPGNQLPQYIQDQIITLYNESDLSNQEIADAVGVKRNYVYKRLKCLKLFGELYPPITVSYGRPSVLNHYQKEVSLSLLYGSEVNVVSTYSRTSMTVLLLTSMR
jgi:transposase